MACSGIAEKKNIVVRLHCYPCLLFYLIVYKVTYYLTKLVAVPMWNLIVSNQYLFFGTLGLKIFLNPDKNPNYMHTHYWESFCLHFDHILYKSRMHCKN